MKPENKRLMFVVVVLFLVGFVLVTSGGPREAPLEPKGEIPEFEVDKGIGYIEIEMVGGRQCFSEGESFTVTITALVIGSGEGWEFEHTLIVGQITDFTVIVNGVQTQMADPFLITLSLPFAKDGEVGEIIVEDFELVEFNRVTNGQACFVAGDGVRHEQEDRPNKSPEI